MKLKKCNKRVIRKEKTKGQFTTLHHSILHDSRLTATAFRILTSILSDSDNHFNISQQKLADRFNLHLDTIKSGLECLEEFGYLRRKELPRGHYYTISEYGNLTPNDETTKEINSPQPNPRFQEKNQSLFMEYVNSIMPYLNNELIVTKMREIQLKHTNDEGVLNFQSCKNEIETIVTKLKKLVYEDLLSVISNIKPYTKQSSVEEFRKNCRKEIFENNQNPSIESLADTWIKFQRRHQRAYKTDYETQLGDRLEQEYDDRR